MPAGCRVIQIFLITAATISVYMTGWFIVVQIRGRNDIADVAWGVRFVLAAAVSLIAGQVHSPRDLLIFALELIWGLRLALHIHNRNRGKGKIHATGSGARNGASGLC